MINSQIQFRFKIGEYVFSVGEKDDILFIKAQHPQETYLFVLNLQFKDLPDNAKKYFESSRQIADYINREGSNVISFQGGVLNIKFQSASKIQKHFELCLRKTNLSHFDMNAIIEQKKSRLEEEVKLRQSEYERRMECERRYQALERQVKIIKEQFCESETQCARLFVRIDQLQQLLSVAQAANCCASCPVHGFEKQGELQGKLQKLKEEEVKAKGTVESAEETVRKAEEAVRITQERIKKNEEQIRQREEVIKQTTERIKKLQEESLQVQEQVHNLKQVQNGANQVQNNPAHIALIKKQNDRSDRQAVFSYENFTAATVKEIVSLKWNALQILSLNGNKLRQQGVTILTSLNWPQLQKLDLANNAISQLIWQPKNISKLTKLTLYVNVLKDIPKNIVELTELQILFLDSNELTRVPPQLQALNSLQKLEIHQNRIPNIQADQVIMALLVKGVQCLDLKQR